MSGKRRMRGCSPNDKDRLSPGCRHRPEATAPPSIRSPPGRPRARSVSASPTRSPCHQNDPALIRGNKTISTVRHSPRNARVFGRFRKYTECPASFYCSEDTPTLSCLKTVACPAGSCNAGMGGGTKFREDFFVRGSLERLDAGARQGVPRRPWAKQRSVEIGDSLKRAGFRDAGPRASSGS